MSPDHAAWPLPVQLLAKLVNTNRDLVWLQTDDATKKPPKNRPEPILPPWQEPAPDPNGDSKTFGNARMTLDETKDWLGW